MNRLKLDRYIVLLFIGICPLLSSASFAVNMETMEPIRISEDGSYFIYALSGERFIPWGFNYDRDYNGRLLEDYMYDEWDTVLSHLAYMKQLGGNAVRIHLQVEHFMRGPDEPNQTAFEQLGKLLDAAQEIGIYVNITGLGCYLKDRVPDWYNDMDEKERWAVQARFWEAVAQVASGHPAVFCYDLMNEPIIGGSGDGWLPGEGLGGKHFVQRITLEPGERSREEIAKAWVDTLVTAIRKHDPHTLITVGVIPWALTFPNAKPIFYSEEAGANLDFVSVHFYPRSGEIEEALTALAVYDIGKPLVIEEYFPMHCNLEEMNTFMDKAKERVDGWFSFYWGMTIEAYAEKIDKTMGEAITMRWLEFLRDKGPEMIHGHADIAD